MTVHLFQRIQVKDFDKWLNPDPDALAPEMKAQGVLAYSLYRNADGPNAVQVHLQFADHGTMNSFRKWYDQMIVEWPKMFPGSE